jgi:hypothetical protein
MTRNALPTLTLLTLLAILPCSGCQSSKAEIDRRTQQIVVLADATVDELDAAVETGEIGDAAMPHIEAAKDNQEKITDEADKARTALHGVEDTTPWWGRTLGNLAIAGVLIALVILLWQTGIGFVIKRICYAIGLLIPRSTRASAALDAEAVVRRRACSEQREAIAAKRASDPAYDAEFKRQKKRKQRDEASRHAVRKEIVTS